MKIVKESILNESGISNKDWDRMLDLVMKGDEGEKVAQLIKDKNKAINRFVAGLKLDNRKLNTEGARKGWGFGGAFRDLGDKAIKLGATIDEIEELYDNTQVPAEYIQKMTKLGGKKLNDRFVGSVSKAILDMGFDIIYQPHNGYAITYPGKDAMSRNGRKWTIGYKSKIDLGSSLVDFNFDAITDEGDGPTYYIVDNSSDSIFSKMISWNGVGKNEFISKLRSILQSVPVTESLNESHGRISFKTFEEKILKPLAQDLGVELIIGKTNKTESYAQKIVDKFYNIGNVVIMARDIKVAGMGSDDVYAWIINEKDITKGRQYSPGWGNYEEFVNAIKERFSSNKMPAEIELKSPTWTKEKLSKLIKDLRMGAQENEMSGDSEIYDIVDSAFSSERGLKKYIESMGIKDPAGWLANQI